MSILEGSLIQDWRFNPIGESDLPELILDENKISTLLEGLQGLIGFQLNEVPFKENPSTVIVTDLTDSINLNQSLTSPNATEYFIDFKYSTGIIIVHPSRINHNFKIQYKGVGTVNSVQGMKKLLDDLNSANLSLIAALQNLTNNHETRIDDIENNLQISFNGSPNAQTFYNNSGNGFRSVPNIVELSGILYNNLTENILDSIQTRRLSIFQNQYLLKPNLNSYVFALGNFLNIDFISLLPISFTDLVGSVQEGQFFFFFITFNNQNNQIRINSHVVINKIGSNIFTVEVIMLYKNGAFQFLKGSPIY